MPKIYVAGHRGMVGSAICRELAKDQSNQIVTADRSALDLTNQSDVRDFMAVNQVDQVYLAAAKVGGIHANNTYPAEFIYENLMIQSNVIHSAYTAGVKKLLFLGSSCIYPRLAEQPINEAALLSGYLEPTNEPYAVAKIAGIKMCESYNRQYGTDYRSVMPTNLYGPYDNYHPENSHVIPGLIRRFHEAKLNKDPTVTAWGTGAALREFLHVNDMASASVYVMNLDRDASMLEMSPRANHINVGTGVECSVKQLTEMISEVVGFSGNIIWDDTKPDGSPRKLMDSTRLLSQGWRPEYDLRSGLADAYKWFIANVTLDKH